MYHALLYHAVQLILANSTLTILNTVSVPFSPSSPQEAQGPWGTILSEGVGGALKRTGQGQKVLCTFLNN